MKRPVMVMRAPMAPSQVIFSPRVKNAKIIVTTGIRYKPQVTLTVPNILQALFQALKQKPLAIIPRKQRLNQLSGFENRRALVAFSSVTSIDSRSPVKRDKHGIKAPADCRKKCKQVTLWIKLQFGFAIKAD